MKGNIFSASFIISFGYFFDISLVFDSNSLDRLFFFESLIYLFGIFFSFFFCFGSMYGSSEQHFVLA